YSCPYKSKWKMCCDKSYHYEGCIYPLEDDGKCGTRHKCKCPDEYSLTVEDVNSRNCQPGKYCILNDGASETIKYSTCTCDRGVYTDVDNNGKCGTTIESKNQSIKQTCKDKEGNKFHQCYCDIDDYPKTVCEYGGKNGTCRDSRSGREYYKDCRTSAEACEDEGYYNDCDSRTTFGTSSSSTCYKGGDYSYGCENGAQCPYNSEYYKCVFSAKKYCNNLGYTNETDVKQNGACQDAYGVTGTKEFCSKRGNNGKYYYRCKVTCMDQIANAVNQGYLYPNQKVMSPNGYSAVYRTDTRGNHLYLRGNAGMPRATIGMNDDDSVFSWEHDNMAGASYVSINGFHALYDVDSVRYSACQEGRSNYRNWPKLFLSQKRIPQGIRKKLLNKTLNGYSGILNVDLSDISVIFVYNSGSDDNEKYYQISKDVSWKNVLFGDSTDFSGWKDTGLDDTGNMPSSTNPQQWGDVVFIGDRDDGGSKYRNKIHLNANKTIRFSGKTYFWAYYWCFSKYSAGDTYHNEGCSSLTQFHFGSKSKVIFENAEISSDNNFDWDGAATCTMLFKNSSGHMGKVWSQWSIGLLDSDVSFAMVHIQPHNNDSANTSFGGTLNTNCIKKTPGIYLKNSKMTTGKNTGWHTVVRKDSDYGKIFISDDSKLVVQGPLRLGSGSSVCLPNSGSTYYVKTKHKEGGYRLSDTNGNVIYPYDGEKYDNQYYYDKKKNWGCMPSSQCDPEQYKRSYSLGNSSGGGNWRGTSDWKPGWSGNYLMPACYNMQICGMGYNN
ncbi:MAG: hypothetical protein IJ529_01635, partial [Alphaproteobacteria bacterium]|nr:hypothetical protein [Alphaproteobacteria bacterium]